MDAHPAAEFFPLMAGEELQALADDIKANGLRNPIVRTEDGQILDGRNRFAACQLAEVEPQYVTANGGDPLALVVSLNVKRRNLTAGQKAIAAAEAWAWIERMQERVEAEHEDTRLDANAVAEEFGGKVLWSKVGPGRMREVLAQQFGIAHGYISQARALVQRDPLAVSAVKAGKPLAEAYDALREREREALREDEQRTRLKMEYAELAEAVERGKMDFAQAVAEVAEREQKRQVEEQERQEATERVRGYLRAALDHLVYPEEVAQAHAARLAEQVKGDGELTADRFRSAAAVASWIAESLEAE